MIARAAALTCAVCAIAAVTIAGGARTRSFTIDSTRSRATVEVGKSGVLSFAAGHTHEVEARGIKGTLAVDVDDPTQSKVHVDIDASALKVTGKGESTTDVPKVQETMSGAQVLDVQTYRTITFASTSVAVKDRTGNTLNTIVTGTLTIRNVTRPVSVPVRVRIAGDTLNADGHFSIKQTDFGIKPVSVGGVVSVKDAVNIAFTIVGR
jgi:polyisoprenoid-binding protein YceI